MRTWVSSDAYRLIIAAVVEARREAGFTQRELARRLSKPPSFIAKVELGERRLDVLEFIALARALGFSPIDMLAKIEARLPGDLQI